MSAQVPSVTCNNGAKIPIVGLGTWKSEPGVVIDAVCSAIDVGYRHVDCAFVYQNEAEVGEGIRRKIADKTIAREDLFVTSKLWNTFHAPEDVIPALKRTLSSLGLEYVDLYLIHWPVGYLNTGEMFPKNVDGSCKEADVDYVTTWKAMEAAVERGLAKNIGLSNFNSEQITRILDNCAIKPVTNQIECHPYLNQKKLVNFCKEKRIVVTAYSPLGSPDRPWAKPGESVLLDDPKIVAIAKKYNKTPAQVTLRYQVQRGVIVIPKSVTPSRIQSNIQLFDFELSAEDVAEIEKFDCNGRICPENGAKLHKYYPFNIEF